MIITSLLIAIIVSIASMASSLFISPNLPPKCGFLSYITGNFLAPQNCKVLFEWKEPSTVGNSFSFIINV
jgi:hypothetical protein